MNVRQVIPKDAIPSVDEPRFDDEYFGDPDEEVIVFRPEDGEARAYPVRILHYHEIVNDSAAGRPIAVTWCPLCGSAVVYDRTVDGRELEFGVSGKLADDDLVMYDRETGSEWKQSSGECIAVFATPDGIHAFENPGFEFEPTDAAGVFAADGTRWDGATGEGEDGRALSLLPARRLFAFAWQDDHGGGSFYEEP